jgi:hypothetical protein
MIMVKHGPIIYVLELDQVVLLLILLLKNYPMVNPSLEKKIL